MNDPVPERLRTASLPAGVKLALPRQVKGWPLTVPVITTGTANAPSDGFTRRARVGAARAAVSRTARARNAERLVMRRGLL